MAENSRHLMCRICGGFGSQDLDATGAHPICRRRRGELPHKKTYEELEAEVLRLRAMIAEPVQSFGTPELIAWADKLQEIIAAFPEDLDVEVFSDILRGSADKVAEAGGAIAGGHTVRDREPKYGLAVVGTAHPDRIIRNSTARPGDVLFLSKPLGIGICGMYFAF